MKAKIYGGYLNPDKKVKGHPLPFFWLHWNAEEINGYDLCSANIIAFEYALSEGFFLCDLLIKNKWYKAFVYVTHRSGRNEGLIMLIDDLEGIEHALTEYHNTEKTLLKYFPTGYEHFKEDLKNNHPLTYQTILSCVHRF